MAEDFNPAQNPDNAGQPTSNPVDPASTPADPASEQQPAEETVAKPKTNAELKAALDAALTENATLKEQIGILLKKLPPSVTAKPGHKVVFIKSNGVACLIQGGKKYIEGDVNGNKFKVLCDEQQEVPDHVAEALAGVIKAQQQR